MLFVKLISQVAEEIVPQLLTVAIEQVGFKACLIQYAIQIPPVGADFLGKLRLMEFLILYLVGHHFAYTHENTMVFFFFFLVFHKHSIVIGTCRPSTARKTERCGLLHHIHGKPRTPHAASMKSAHTQNCVSIDSIDVTRVVDYREITLYLTITNHQFATLLI
jgi:hypothetical protein